MYKCLDDNNYNKDKCEGFIENGKYCKKFWVNYWPFFKIFCQIFDYITGIFFIFSQLAVAIDRRSKGIYPEVPYGEEREKVRQEFLNRYQKPVIHVKVQSWTKPITIHFISSNVINV